METSQVGPPLPGGTPGDAVGLGGVRVGGVGVRVGSAHGEGGARAPPPPARGAAHARRLPTGGFGAIANSFLFNPPQCPDALGNE